MKYTKRHILISDLNEDGSIPYELLKTKRRN